MNWMDRFAENSARGLAQRTSRRSLLAALGSLLVGSALIPLLPVARGAESKSKGAGGPKQSVDDSSSCNYWRHCAIDGFLCSCCGGSQSMCPPGTNMSPITWIGTCHNPADGIDYVISYNDCCGKGTCGRCFCNRNEGNGPMYDTGRSNDYNWCSGNATANIPYNCSTARIVGVAK